MNIHMKNTKGNIVPIFNSSIKSIWTEVFKIQIVKHISMIQSFKIFKKIAVNKVRLFYCSKNSEVTLEFKQ